MNLKAITDITPKEKGQSERGSLALEAALSFSFALILVFSALGTLLTLYIDTHVEWAVKNSSDQIRWAPELLNNQPVLTKTLFNDLLEGMIVEKGLINLIKEVSIKRDENIYPMVDQWKITYDYTFFSFKTSGETTVFFMNGLPNDGLSMETATVFITTYGERYHIESCFHLRKSKYPVDLKEAQRRGYTACKNCHGSLEEE